MADREAQQAESTVGPSSQASGERSGAALGQSAAGSESGQGPGPGPAPGPAPTSGALYAFGAYTLWGLFPIYWKWLHAFSALELIAHRVLWAFIFYWLLATQKGSSRFAWAKLLVSKQTRGPVFLAGFLLTSNWLLYIWAINNGHIVEASLGYFITPLLNILTGRLILKERLSRIRWVSVALAAIGVSILTFQSNQLPWIALGLAASFSTYGLIRKRLTVSVFDASTAETAVTLVPALGFVIFQRFLGGSEHDATGLETLLLAATGVVTGLPLIWFAQAARKLPLSMLGFFQYIAPTIQFVLGVFAYNEPFNMAKMQAFLFIWAALAVFSWETVHSARKKRA